MRIIPIRKSQRMAIFHRLIMIKIMPQSKLGNDVSHIPKITLLNLQKTNNYETTTSLHFITSAIMQPF